MSRGRENLYGGMSETGNWNVADDFARVKIMIPLAKCDVYEDIAKFGYESFLDELINIGYPNEVLRFKGLNRLINELIKICKNSVFALKVKGTKDKVKELENKLNKIKKVLPFLMDSNFNPITKKQSDKLNEVQFEAVLNVVLQIKSAINHPLNKNHLIFVDKEEETEEEFKARIAQEILLG